METDFYQYWGKYDRIHAIYHPVAFHCLDAAAVGFHLLAENIVLKNRISILTGWSEEFSVNFILFWLSIHDLGKFTESFQGQIKELFFRINGWESTKEYSVYHGELGYKLWEKILPMYFFNPDLPQISPEIKRRDAEKVLYCLAKAAFGHHGTPPNVQMASGFNDDQLFSKKDVEVAVNFVTECKNIFFSDNYFIPSLLSKNKIRDFYKLSWILTGLSVFTDWIASDEKNFTYIERVIPLETYWKEYALPQAEKAIIRLGLKNPKVSDKIGIQEIFPIFAEKGLNPSPLQLLTSEIVLGSGPHLFIIEESTGGGKTEASITLAHRLMAIGDANGMYIGLPTMATANAMYDRLVTCYKKLYTEKTEPSLVLAHGKRNYSEKFLQSIITAGYSRPRIADENKSRATCSAWLSDNRKKSLLAPVGVGTIDQALVSILPVRHQSLRLYGLFQNVLIVDEVHAYDSYMARLLQTQLAFMASLGASVILLSATLPLDMKKSFINFFAAGAGYDECIPVSSDYPLVTSLSGSGLKEIPVPARAGTARVVDVKIISSQDDVIEKLTDVLKKGSCACWIRNTVQDAIDAYHFFSGFIPKDKISLFHSGFVMGDRLRIEDETISNFGKYSEKDSRNGRLLIATQVVEQSLDLDFDYMVTDLCPIDLIIQRAGRLQRHKRDYQRDDPVLWIFSPDPVDNPDSDWYRSIFKRSSYVYPKHGDLYLTSKLLKEYGCIKTPEQARDLIEGVYGNEGQKSIPESLRIIDEKEKCKRDSEKGLAINNSLNFQKSYEYTNGEWDSDEQVPTRLADPTVMIRIGVIDEGSGTIKPIDSSLPTRWDLSQVTIRKSKFPVDPMYDSKLKELVKRVKDTMSDNCEGIIFIPLYKSGDGEYSNQIFNQNNRQFLVKYSEKEGIFISPL